MAMKLWALVVATSWCVACSSSHPSGGSSAVLVPDGPVGAHSPSQRGCDSAWAVSAGSGSDVVAIEGCQDGCAIAPDCSAAGLKADKPCDNMPACKRAMIPDTLGHAVGPTIDCAQTFTADDGTRGCCGGVPVNLAGRLGVIVSFYECPSQ